MSSSPSNSLSDPMITDLFAKTLHTILESRSPFVSHHICNPNNWFNLVLDVLLWANDKIVERWILQHQPRQSGHIYKKSKKRSMILLRSLYVTVRLLPAYKVFRALNSSLSHRISSFVEPFTRAEDAQMNQFSFAPIDTPSGKFSLSVSYLSTLEDVGSVLMAPLPMQFIPDYINSPATDRPGRFLSVPSGGEMPDYGMFMRRHSWSNERGGAPLVSPSPSPTLMNSYALGGNGNYCLKHYRKSFDEYCPSPQFSLSTSPSPPTHVCSNRLPDARCSSQANALRSQVTTTSAPRTSSPESKLRMRKESPRFQECLTGLPLQKVLSFGREEVLNISGLSDSPRVPFSRSSSRLTFLDEIDDPEGAYPFAIDDEDLTDSCYRAGHSDDAAVGALVIMLKTAPPLRQDLSGSALNLLASKERVFSERIQCDTQMEGGTLKLNNADSSPKVSALGLFKSRTAADALAELRHYKEMKEMLLEQGGLPSLNIYCTEQSADRP